MHSRIMSMKVQEFLNASSDLQWKKNDDYHPEKVAYLEILETAYECGMTVEQDLWAKIRKQYIALRSFVLEGKLESEPPRSRAMDVSVYMGMLVVWIEHRDTIVRDARNFVRDYRHCALTGSLVMENTCVGGRRSSPAEFCDRCRFYAWLNSRVDTN